VSIMTAPPLIVLLVDSDAERAQIVEDGLSGASITKLTSSDSGELLKTVTTLQPDVIIMDCETPDKDTIDSLKLVAKENPKPIVMFVEDGDGVLAKEAVRAGVSAYIVDGLSSSRVQPVIEVAIERFNMFNGLQKELEKSKEDLVARKTIERAKGILMDKRNVTESEAFASMRKLAMQESITIKEVADKILSVASILGDKF